MKNTFIVVIGSGIGGGLRHLCNVYVAGAVGTSFPWAVLGINVSGSTAMGIIIGWFAVHGGASQELRLFLTAGIVAGFTTFSTFSLDIALLTERRSLILAATYVVASIGLSLFGLIAGIKLTEAGIR